MTDPLRPPDPAPAPTLEYARPQHAMAVGWQLCLGILLGAVPVLAAALAGPFALGIAGIVATPLLVAAVLFAIGLRLRRGAAYRPMAAGIWTGIALAALIDGVCIATISGWRVGHG